ncbi:MAG: ATP-dependent helicase [Oscillospiraceae bacterium]|nr:ATP-dependent helicase [Oscillospiraceae bacterium]
MQDILSFFRLSQDPNDLEAFRNIYYKLFLTKKVYLYAEQHATEWDNLFDLVLSLSILPDHVSARIRGIRNRLPKLYHMKPIRAIEYIEDSLGYHEYMSACEKNGLSQAGLRQKLNILKAIAAEYPTVDAFLSRLKELEERMDLSKEKNEAKITLSTVHSAKGLEFDNVILLDLIDELFPTANAIEGRQIGDPALYEEEVRLFYVAATRAKKRLYLMEAAKISSIPAIPSRFLSHLLNGEEQESIRMEGRKIFHSTYRNGVILSVEDDTVTAEFELFGQKSFSLSYCLEKGIIRIDTQG